MEVCTYKDCEQDGINQCSQDAFLCVEHTQEWIKNVDGMKDENNKDWTVRKMLGTYSRATNKNREQQVSRLVSKSMAQLNVRSETDAPKKE